MGMKFRVLHVDDNPFDRQLVRDALEQESDQFVVTAATSQQEFESQLAVGEYDLVLTDFNILGFEGLQVIDAVHQDSPAIPVVVITGTGSEEIAVEAMKRGAADYVIKTPHHIRRLPMAILSAIRQKKLQEERVQSEQALRESEERLRAFANALPDLAFIMDEDGRYVQLLSTSEHLLYPIGEQQLGKLVHEVLPRNIADQILSAIYQTVETGISQSLEYKLDVLAGLRWFEGRISPMTIKSDDKALVVYIARDITDRKKAEWKLIGERNLLRTLIDNVPDYIFVKDCEGRFIVCNTAHAATAHLTPPEVIGLTALDVFTPEIIQMFHDDDEKVMTSGESLVNEERCMIDRNGRPQWVLTTKVPLLNENSEVVGVVSISRDITLRRQAEDALRSSEEHLRAVVSGTPVILFALDVNGVFTLWQGQGLSAIGLEPDAYLGKSIFETFGTVFSNLRELIRLVLDGEETHVVEAFDDMTFDIRLSPLRNKSGEVGGIIGVATDITERLRVERLKIELEQEQEVVALKERFIATASHDFRTPLSLIKMSSTLLESRFDQMTPERRLAKLRQITLQIDHMVQLLDDILTISKAHAGKLAVKPEQIALKAFCEQIWENFQNMSEKTHTINFVYQCDMDEVTLDPNLIQYILANLLSNAIKYSPVDGRVLFEVANEADNLIFQIRDNGIGIPEQDQARLFQPFHRAENTQGIDGTGLGLSIVKSYVECHNGQIQFESQEGEGTTFTVIIPLQAP